MQNFTVATAGRYQLVSISKNVQNMVSKSKIENGLVLIFVPHTTAAVLITENEPRLLQDWLKFFTRMVSGFRFQHGKPDSNGDSHIISGLLGSTKILSVEDGWIILGAHQHIFLVELDGPQKRNVMVQVY